MYNNQACVNMMKLDTNHEVVLTMDRQQYARKRGFVGKTKTHKKVKRHGKKSQNLSRDTFGKPSSGNWNPEVEKNYLFLLRRKQIIFISCPGIQ